MDMRLFFLRFMIQKTAGGKGRNLITFILAFEFYVCNEVRFQGN